MRRRSICAVGLLAMLAMPAVAAPVDELLHAAPPDAAFVLVLRDARGHITDMRKSPFAATFPDTPLGQRLLESPEVKKLRAAIHFVATQTDTPADSLFDDVLGDGVVFAVRKDSKQERSILLIRPAKPEVLDRFFEKLNALQVKSGEITAVTSHSHQGKTYTERPKARGRSDYYASRQGTFAFSSSEDEIRDFLDREPADKPSPFAVSLRELQLESAAAVMLIQPRVLDAEIQAKLSTGTPAEQAFLGWFESTWKKLDSVALYLRLTRDAELGIAVRVREGESRLAPTVASELWTSIPEDAFFAMAGRQTLSELVNAIHAMLPANGRQAVRGVVEQTVVPIVGKDKLPMVVDAIGPNWAMWFEPPGGEGFLPATVFAVEVQATNAAAGRTIERALQYVFQTVRVMHNARGGASLELVDEKDGAAVIHSLVGDVFPPGVRPSFAMKEGYLLISSDAGAIRRFRKPTVPAATPEVPLARFHATALRAYLNAQGPRLARFVAERSGASAAEMDERIKQMSGLLESLDRVDVIARTTGPTIHVAVRLVPTKPLK